MNSGLKKILSDIPLFEIYCRDGKNKKIFGGTWGWNRETPPSCLKNENEILVYKYIICREIGENPCFRLNACKTDDFADVLKVLFVRSTRNCVGKVIEDLMYFTWTFNACLISGD